MTHNEILLKQVITALSLTLNFTAHSKNECIMCMTSEGAENLAMRMAEKLAGNDVEFPCALYGGRLGLVITIDTDGECVFYDDFEVFRMYPHEFNMTGEYMSINEYNNGHWERDEDEME